MSAHHHHHPHEGRGDGSHSPKSSSKPIHHDWRFYVAGLFILIALLLYIFSGDLAWRPGGPPQPSPSPSDGIVR